MSGLRNDLRQQAEEAPPARLRAALATLHWSGRGLAAILRTDERKVRRWASGAYDTPEPVLCWLETLAAFVASHPPPTYAKAPGSAPDGIADRDA